MYVESTRELTRVEVAARSFGQNDIWLRKDIETSTDEESGQTKWTANEQHVLAAIDAAEAEANFDELWNQAVLNAMTEDERIAQNEQLVLDLCDATAELYEMLLG